MSRILSPTRWDGVRRSAVDQARPPQAVQDFGPDRRSRQDWHLLRQPAAAMSASLSWSTRTCRRGQADRAVAKPATVSGRPVGAGRCRQVEVPLIGLRFRYQCDSKEITAIVLAGRAHHRTAEAPPD